MRPTRATQYAITLAASNEPQQMRASFKTVAALMDDVKESPMAEDVHCIVTHSHADYQRGDRISDPKLVEAMLRDHPAKCVAIKPQPETAD